ncbi:APC family permease [Mycolicibacterium llatzerense]|uniref:APC family permease n=1 Tax=Mycolicibacterium llatzerense TaxID=280871 RepID=UPI000ADDF6B5|nr:amino acid permease [Mycolicibacterium llatzerense]
MMTFLHSRPILLLAFAFAVMADPVSSVAYAIEAALRALGGDLALLIPAMSAVVLIIALVVVNYQQLIARYPRGGGASAATGEAFGEGWAFLPIGALIVDFVLTIAISVAAGASAIIAYMPTLAPYRIVLAAGLAVLVGGATWFGHLGRLAFAAMTVAFVAVTTLVLLYGTVAEPLRAMPSPASEHPSHSALFAVLLAFPVAMALATGVEAPSSAIAQLGQLDDRGRHQFGRITLWLTLVIVGTLTMGLTIEARVLNVGIPPGDSTQIAELARHCTPGPVFAVFQLVTALLLLSAASSSFQAGPGLLKALARTTHGTGILPGFLGRTNIHHTPYWGVVFFTIVSVIATAAAGGQDQTLVLYYAVSVFLSFLAGLVAMAYFSYRERNRGHLLLNGIGATVVFFVLVINLGRGYPIISLAATVLIAAALWQLWITAGRPRGIREVEAMAETISDQPEEPPH